MDDYPERATLMAADQIMTMILRWIASGAVFILVAGGAYFLINLVRNRVRIGRRLHHAVVGLRPGQVDVRIVDGATELKSTVGNAVASLGRLMPLGEQDRNKIYGNLQRAGYLSTNALSTILGIKFAGLVVGIVAGLIAMVPVFPGVLGIALGIVGGSLIGVLLNVVPEMVLGRLASRRMRRIDTGLAEALDLLIVCLESGLTFDRALKRTVENLRSFQPELAKEFGQVVLDMSLHGRTREEALDRLAKRLDNQTFRDLTTTVAQSERHGTPLADSLRKLGGSVRVEAISKMQEKMARLPTFLILPSIAFILPGIMVIVGGPAIVQLMETMQAFGAN